LLSLETHRENQEAIREGSYGRFLYNFYRTYDPNTGRYLEADPIGMLGILHRAGVSMTDRVVWFRLRDFDGRVVNWTPKEPLFFAGSSNNLFGYAFANPVNMLDRNGLDVTNTGPTVVLILGGGSNELIGGDAGLIRCLPSRQTDEGVHDAVAVPGQDNVYKTPDLSNVTVTPSGITKPSGPISRALVYLGGGGVIPPSKIGEHGQAFRDLLDAANELADYPFLGPECECPVVEP
jgi:hypothetical protein